jgi:hypothetical protein
MIQKSGERTGHLWSEWHQAIFSKLRLAGRRSRRHMRTRKVMVLVTGTALNRIHALPIRSASDLHRMLVAVVSLAREISRGVAIHGARMA